MNRVLGIKDGSEDGPLVVLVGGLHGNEHTGVHAIINVFRTIEERNLDFKGRLVGLTGNVRAYDLGRRYLDYDLNRCWNGDLIKELKEQHDPERAKAEDLELLELLHELELHSETTHRPKVLVDLHATSSDNGNFIVIPRDEADNPIVVSLRLPIVIDLEKYLAGTLLEYMHHKGFVAFAFEGGLIGSDKALSLHTSGIWELLYAAGVMERQNHHEFAKYQQIVETFIHNLPHKVTVLYHHKVTQGDGFRMKAGYQNFQSVQKGEIVAEDHAGNIIAKDNGLIFMPLYQPLGDDGFFIVEEIEPHI